MIFQHLRLFTLNIATQQAFYQQLLELPLLEQTKESVTFQIGASRLEFVEHSIETFYHFAFNIPSHQFIEAKTWLSQRVRLIQDSNGQDVFHSENWNADMFYFYDAEGNIVEFIARHDLKPNTGLPFSAKSLECISELGIVTNDVPQTAKRLNALTDMPLYRTVMDDMFVPVGDETALFIVVKQGRIWFPETKAAKITPFMVLAELNGHSTEINHEVLGLV
jgi:catechol-2,3-dioxygenase